MIPIQEGLFPATGSARKRHREGDRNPVTKDAGNYRKLKAGQFKHLGLDVFLLERRKEAESV